MANRSELVEPLFHLDPSLSDADALAVLNAPTQTRVDTALYNFIALMQILGEQSADAVLQKLETAAQSSSIVRAIYQAVIGAGLNFADSVVQEKITALQTGGVFTEEEATALKRIGVKPISELERLEIQGVTEQDVHDTRAEQHRLSVEARLHFLFNWGAPLAARGTLTWQQVLDKAASL